MKFFQKILVFAILMLALATQSNAQNCVGVHVTQQWDCVSGTASATAHPEGGTAPYTYAWSNGDMGQTASGLTPGQHYVTVTDAVGCLEVKACVVIHPECCISTNWDVTPDGCQIGGQGTITIFEIQGGQPPYKVTLPNGTIKITDGNSPIFITNLEAGDYVISIEDATGCNVGDYITVTTTPGPTATISLVTIACGQNTTSANVSVTGGTAPYTYLWDNGTTTASAVLNAGTHNVTVTDKNGCTAIATTMVSLPQPPVVTLATTNTTCDEENGSITSSVTGGTTPYAYAWSNGATTQNLANVPAGAYTLTVTGANACSAVSFATVLPSIGAQDTIVGQVGCDSVVAYGMTFYQTTTNSFTENVNGCDRDVKIHAVVLTTGGTITQDITACYGTTVTVNGMNYTDDATVTTTGTGTCPGQVIWNLQFTEMPDTISIPPTQVCGLVDTTFMFAVSHIGQNGCPDLVVLKSLQVNKVQQEIAWANQIEQCGLIAKTDTLYKGMMFNQATCTQTITLQKLVTNPIQQVVIWGDDVDTCGITAQVHEIADSLGGIDPSLCTQFEFKHKLVVTPFTKDTVLGTEETICGATAKSFLAFDGESFENCDQTLFGHMVNVTEWTSVSVYGPEVHFCGDTTAIFINFDGRKIGANCTDTTFLHRVFVHQSTQDTTWNTPLETCGFITGTFVVTDSLQVVNCHTQVFAKKVTVKPIFSQEVIGDTVRICGGNFNAFLATDSTVTDTANCLQMVFKHWVATYPVAISTEQADFCANSDYLWLRNGKVYNQPCVYTDTTTTVDGCPDIAILYLNELPLAYDDTTVFVCPNGMFEYEGNMYGPGTEEEFYYVSDNGCDSTFVIKVVESQNPITINFPGNVVLNLPTMSQNVIDNLVATTAAGDTISITGGIITESLMKINDSLWVQTWNVITPCDTLSRSRTIMVLQPSIPPNTCDVLILHDGTKNPVNVIVSDKGEPEDIRYTLVNVLGNEVSSGSLNIGSNQIQVANLQPGTYYLQIRANVLVNGTRKSQILKDTKGRNAFCVVVPE